MGKKFVYKANEEVRTYVVVRQAADYAYEKANSERDGSTFGFMAAIVFAAFTLEAYVNHLGPKGLDDWEQLEKKRISTRKKLIRLAEKLNVPLNKEERPLKTLLDALAIRNQLAHGRTETITTEGETGDPEVDPFKLSTGTDWQAFCDEKNASRVLTDVDAVIHLLHEAADLGRHPYTSAGHGSAVVRVKEESDQMPPGAPDETGRTDV